MDNYKQFYEINLKETKIKIKESVKFDNFIIQAINNIDELNRTSNTLVKRLREWYELENPEFSRKVSAHEKFVELVVKGDEEKTDDSMGAVLTEEDKEPIIELAKEIEKMYLFKQKQEEYIEKIMKKNCPNITAVAGANIGARLMSLAGGMKRLIFFPASTVQLLGAEKALFRHMKTGAKPPKHGIIHEHPIVSKVGKREKGKASRALADKISLASRIDYFKGEFIGDKLREELEERFK